MSPNRKIIHIDMDAFYASVEQRDTPAYRGKPVIVGGNPHSRGVVAACSYEARSFGVHSAMPCRKAATLCPHAVFVRPRMDRYKEVSNQVMDIFREYTDLVEPLSLDEAFLDVTDNPYHDSATLIARRIRQQIREKLNLTASAGVSCNKFLAKVASEINKPDGIATIPPEQAIAFINTLPVGKFFGVGRVTEQKMVKLGIKTGEDLAKRSRDSLIFHFGKAGSFFYDIARGKDTRRVEPSRQRKSLGSETTLSSDTSDLSEISTILGDLSEKLVRAMDTKHTCGCTLTLKVRYDNFETITRSVTVPRPIQGRDEIDHLLPRLLHATQAGTRKVRLLGLTLSKLTGPKKVPVQLYLPFMDRYR
ncbi:DNA polymerase IV [Desulforhopalus singaporensis]|nr:DNA polymerase IV [Desulforhopalus singaporensis]